MAKARDSLERAVRSYLAWTTIVELQSPMATLRAEHMGTDLRKCLPTFDDAGLAVTEERLETIKHIPQDVNSSTEKFSHPKPNVEASLYRALPGDLRRDLADARRQCSSDDSKRRRVRVDRGSGRRREVRVVQYVE